MPWAPELVETHSSTLVFLGDRAYKIKKPLDLGFLDFTTVEARREACHREVELNRRLAPDVYLGVADVVGEGGTICDHLVVMRRMPADRRLSTLVRAGAPVDDHLWHVAHLLAAFHSHAERSPLADEIASMPAMRARWQANTDALLGMDLSESDADGVGAIQALADRYLDGRAPLFDQRIAEGRANDGHGDLLADDVFCLEDGPRILDCLEFDDRLRLGDGLADAAFLTMDLERLGRLDLADRFLVAYGEHLGDSWPSSLAHHHVAYRAQVRAKVAAIRAGQDDPDAMASASTLLALARSHLDEARVRLILVGGLPGTGKSTLAKALGHAVPGVVLRADEVRKELAGLSSDQVAPAEFRHGLYDPATTQATYETMLGRARTALSLGECVVIDASWTSAAWRAQARDLAVTVHADLVELRCHAPVEVAAGRMAARAVAGGDPSDATPAIAAAMAADADPWPEAVGLDTVADPATVLRAALARISPGTGPR